MTRSKDVEITQGNRLQTVAVVKGCGIEFAGQLGNAVGRDRHRAHGLGFAFANLVAIRGRRRGIDHPSDTGIARRDQHLKRTVDAVRIRFQRVGYAAGHRWQRRLMNDVVRAAAKAAHGLDIGNASDSERKIAVQGLENVQILLIAGQQIVDDPHPLSIAQEPFGDMGTDESGAAGYHVCIWHDLSALSACIACSCLVPVRLVQYLLIRFRLRSTPSIPHP